MLTILRGSVVGQLIVFASLPVLSRLFPPEAFGSLQSIQSILALLLIVCSLRLEIAVLTCTDEELSHLVPACLALCAVTSLLTLIGMLVLWFFFQSTLTQIGSSALLIPLALLLSGAGQVLTYLGLRLQAFSINATAKVTQAVVYVVSAVSIGSIWASVLSLTLADVLGRAAFATAAIRGEFRSTLRRCAPLQRQTVIVVKRYAKLPLMSMPSAIVNVLGSSFTAVMLLALFSSREAGNYAMVERAVGAPIAVIAGAASQAFMAALSEQPQAGNALARFAQRALFVRLIMSHGLVGLLPMLLLMFGAPTLVPLLLGPEWSVAGEYAQFIAPMLYLSFVATPVNMTLVLCERQSWQLAWDLARLVAVGSMWWVIGRGSYSSTVAVVTHCIVTTAFYIGHLLLSYLALGQGSTSATKAYQV